MPRSNPSHLHKKHVTDSPITISSCHAMTYNDLVFLCFARNHLSFCKISYENIKQKISSLASILRSGDNISIKEYLPKGGQFGSKSLLLERQCVRGSIMATLTLSLISFPSIEHSELLNWQYQLFPETSQHMNGVNKKP
jgi:hypothetical protein